MARSRWLRSDIGLDLLRVYLGVALVVRGALFVADPGVLIQGLQADEWLLPIVEGHLVALVHLVGGGLLAVGWLTRWAAAIQLPLLLYATFRVNLPLGLASGDALELSALVLVLLVLYATCFEPGPLSVDRALEKSWAAAEAEPRSPLAPGDLPARWFKESAPPPDAIEGPEARGELDPSPDPPEVRRDYRDSIAVLSLVAAGVTVTIGLIAAGEPVWASAWFIAIVMMFGVWRVGRARFE
jgi:putative oxidoreductase